MDWLNYHHLLYFWVVARTGSISKASRELLVSQPTISTQLKTLETSLGEKLFQRVGRGLELTETGRVVLSYAEEIFSLGRELREAVRHIPEGRPLRLRVGIADVVPKLLAQRILEPALLLPRPVHLIVREGKAIDLEAELGSFTLDLVLADSPLAPTVRVKATSHALGSCAVGFFGVHSLARKYRSGFPESLDDAPVLLPTADNAMRRGIDRWFDEMGVRPRIIGEFDDSALMKAFGQNGHGLFPAPVWIADQLKERYKAHEVGRTDRIQEAIFAITVERRTEHPGILAIFEAADTGMSGMGA